MSRFHPIPRREAVATRASRRRCTLIAAAVLCAVAAGGSAAPAGAAATLVSAGATGSGGNGGARAGAMTPNGRHVAFVSEASDLTPGDGNGAADVFLRDVRDGTTKLVSVDQSGAASAAGASRAPAVTDNGRWVVFVSAAANLVANDANGAEDVFVRDLQTGATTLVSVRADGGGSATGASRSPSISSNGRWVAFSSVAEDLVGNDDNGAEDVFVRDLTAGTTQLVSIDRQAASSGTGTSTSPVMTPSGRHVAFVSNANDLVADDDNVPTDVFLRDLNEARTTLVSIGRDGLGGGKGDSFGPLVSPNGRYVAFTSAARDLVHGDKNQATDAYLRDLRKKTTTLLSTSRTGKRSANGASVALALTPSGRWVAFSSRAKNVVAGDRNDAADVFLRDVRSATTQLVSVTAAERSGNGASDAASISSDGRRVLFASSATNLVATPTSGQGDVFLRDTVDRVTTLASATADGAGGGNGASSAPRITPDGRHALFESAASDLVAGDANGAGSDLFRVAQ